VQDQVPGEVEAHIDHPLGSRESRLLIRGWKAGGCLRSWR
jgi:hypothetical protein